MLFNMLQDYNIYTFEAKIYTIKLYLTSNIYICINHHNNLFQTINKKKKS